MTRLVLVEGAAPGVAMVTLNRPEKYNALSLALLGALRQALEELAGQEALRAIVLTGADPAFCAGLDLGELAAGVDFGTGAIDALRRFPVPVIGAVNGVAVTGGLELALACDFLVASERARFADTHSRVGVVPGWGLSARLPQAVGQAWARQMSFTGDFVDASTACRIGLVNEVLAHETLLNRAVAIAQATATTSRGTLSKVRELYDLVRDGTGGAALQAERDMAAGGLLLETPQQLDARRAAMLARGRAQASSSAGHLEPGSGR
jgi:enoyl-CoA hydratase